jgi:hypothetical protein
MWAALNIFGYALLTWGLDDKLRTTEPVNFGTHIYVSGTTFFTLGYGDITPLEPLGRTLSIIEAGTGFALLAIVIGYLPVLYAAFSRREVNISLLDARAGSPSSAAELLRRHQVDGGINELQVFLSEWEHWAAELLESHLSYPVLCYFRSQHDNQSWLAALTTVLDASALVIVGVSKLDPWQARLTFAMARHAVVDIAQVFRTAPKSMASCTSRLTESDFSRVCAILKADRELNCAETEKRLRDLRAMYEPYVTALSEHLIMKLPPWILPEEAIDNWKTSAWGRIQ